MPREHVVTSISLPPDLLDETDRWADRAGFSGRSDAVRYALRDALDAHGDEARLEGTVVAVVVLRFDHGTEAELTGAKHRYAEEIRSMLHVHSDGGACSEVLIVQGAADRIRDLLADLRGTRGVRTVRTTLVE